LNPKSEENEKTYRMCPNFSEGRGRRVIKQITDEIDMRHQKGEHPRFGTTDTCPLVPVANITMEETVEHEGTGWFIEEYGAAQISMNLTNISITPVHITFDEVSKKTTAQ
jgi:glutamate formiminotransferase